MPLLQRGAKPAARRARRRSRRSSRRRSCARSGRARRRGRRSCTRSRGRRRPRPPPRRPSCAPRSARRRGRGRTRVPRSPRRARCCRRSRCCSATNSASPRRAHREHPAAQPLAGVVVGLAAQVKVIPGASQAPKHWPAEPSRPTAIVSSASPTAPWAARSSLESMPPTLRSTLRIGRCSVTRSPRSSAGPAARPAAGRARPRRRAAPARRWRRGASVGQPTWAQHVGEVDPRALPWSIAGSRSSSSTRPTSSSKRSPSEASSSRTSSATKKKKLTTCSGVPAKRRRSSGSWVAIPTGQVFRWQTRIMMQPVAIKGAVEKPTSSAPSSPATTTSRPVRSPPSVCSTIARAGP